jgi:hypothetical protein
VADLMAKMIKRRVVPPRQVSSSGASSSPVINPHGCWIPGQARPLTARGTGCGLRSPRAPAALAMFATWVARLLVRDFNCIP